MHINLFLIPFVIILGLTWPQKENKISRLIYIILCSIPLIFIAAMRSPEWMTYKYNIDTLVYKEMFENSFYTSWNELWQQIHLRYVGHENEFDTGFTALTKIIGLLTHDFYIYSLLADLIFFIPFGIILYRYCSNIMQIMFAFVFYIALVQVFFFGGARQLFAMGFDLMALISIIDKKRIRTIILFLIGLFIHFSSLLFLIPLLMIWLEISPTILKIIHFASFVLFPVVLTFPNELIVFMGNALGIEKYAEYGKNAIQGGATTFIFMIEILSLFCLIAIKNKDLLQNKTLQTFYVMAPLFTFFAPLIRSNGSMIRISLYYHIFLALLVPFAIDCIFKDRKFAYFVAIGALAFLSLSNGGMIYYFFWQV